ncbi:hypothetical protein K466DRAFT_663318 [Polyporus arcularius HHB13444]|uniref:Uncharacterized protein n=1 Tax=Polyporus arcularius HHB13444 TaxID=1314778 RepID=A0A5C3PBD9_9APHY|nr:hypothetical protein K466DRAFT_663318 [Polyporus arcularius HHB13444]
MSHGVQLEALMAGPLITTLADASTQLDHLAAAAFDDPSALWSTPLNTVPPHELFLQQLGPPQPVGFRATHFPEENDNFPTFDFVTHHFTPEETVQIRGSLVAGAAAYRAMMAVDPRVARSRRAVLRKTRGTRVVKRETAPSKELLKAKQDARRKRKSRAVLARRAGGSSGVGADRT